MADVIRPSNSKSFQRRVLDWMMETFSMEVTRDTTERNHRYLEESLELVQAMGCTQSEAHQLVDYVYGRPVGEPQQEVGGALVTLAALCSAADFDMTECGDRELARCWQNIERIRAKQAGKPKHSPLPGPTGNETPQPMTPTDVARVFAPLPPNEAAALREYGVDDGSHETCERPLTAEQFYDAYIIHFDDAEVPIEVFSGYGAGDGARKAFEQHLSQWNCQLFRMVDDGKRPSKKATEPHPAPDPRHCPQCGPHPTQSSAEHTRAAHTVAGVLADSNREETAELIEHIVAASEANEALLLEPSSVHTLRWVLNDGWPAAGAPPA